MKKPTLIEMKRCLQYLMDKCIIEMADGIVIYEHCKELGELN